MFSKINRFLHAGFAWSPRFALGYPFMILAACGYGFVALVAGLFPGLPRVVLFPPYAVAVAALGVGLSLALMDPRCICKTHLEEFWQ